MRRSASRGCLVSAGVLALPLIIALVVIHARPADLSGASPTSQPGPGELPADTRDNGKADRLGELIDVTTGG